MHSIANQLTVTKLRDLLDGGISLHAVLATHVHMRGTVHVADERVLVEPGPGVGLKDSQNTIYAHKALFRPASRGRKTTKSVPNTTVHYHRENKQFAERGRKFFEPCAARGCVELLHQPVPVGFHLLNERAARHQRCPIDRVN